MSTLIFVDTEDANPTANGWTLREFGAVGFESRKTFHGKDSSKVPSAFNLQILFTGNDKLL